MTVSGLNYAHQAGGRLTRPLLWKNNVKNRWIQNENRLFYQQKFTKWRPQMQAHLSCGILLFDFDRSRKVSAAYINYNSDNNDTGNKVVFNTNAPVRHETDMYCWSGVINFLWHLENLQRITARRCRTREHNATEGNRAVIAWKQITGSHREGRDFHGNLGRKYHYSDRLSSHYISTLADVAIKIEIKLNTVRASMNIDMIGG